MNNSLLFKQARDLLENENDQSFDHDLLLKKKSEMTKELQKIRLVNRKLLFGLWLCKFIKNYKKVEKTEETCQFQTKNPFTAMEFFQNWCPVIILLVIIAGLLIKNYIKLNSVV